MQVTELSNGAKVASIHPELQAEAERPLVLLNGIGAGNEHWGGFPEALGRYCLAVDVTQANGCRSNASMPRFSDAVASTLDMLDHDRVDLLGLSWGGALAQETAIRHGRRLGKVVLAATLHGMQSVPPRFAAMAAMMQSDRSSRRFQRIAGRVYGGDIRTNPELLQQIGIERHTNNSAYRQQLRAVMSWTNTLPRLRNITNPTLILAGADDPIARPVNSWMMARVIPGSKLHIVPADQGGGHLFLHTRPRESSAVINWFLNQSSRC